MRPCCGCHQQRKVWMELQSPMCLKVSSDNQELGKGPRGQWNAHASAQESALGMLELSSILVVETSQVHVSSHEHHQEWILLHIKKVWTTHWIPDTLLSEMDTLQEAPTTVTGRRWGYENEITTLGSFEKYEVRLLEKVKNNNKAGILMEEWLLERCCSRTKKQDCERWQ